MNINWKVRIKNPVWWANLATAIVMPLIVGMGYAWEDMTTWAKLGETLYAAVQNPVVFVSMVTGAVGVSLDPTTKGYGDSKQARTYEAPKEA